MKKLFIFFLIITGLVANAQGTIPSYPTLKLTKLTDGTKQDSIVVVNADNTLKQLPTSAIKGTTNLDQLAAPTGVTVFSSTGNDVVLPLATATNSGLQSPSDKSKIDGIASGATVNETDAYLLDRANHTGTQTISTVTGLQAGLDSKVDKVAGERLINASEISKLSNQSGTNTGDQDLSSYATNANLNLKENSANKNTANGYAGLGSDGKLISSQLPSITISDTFVTASQAAMLAVTAETGDVAVRTDLNKSFILKGTNPTVLGDWQELLTPTSAVTTVFARNGAVTAQTGDYTASMVGAPSGSGNSTGTNTGDQTTVTGNAGTATALQTARTIGTVTGDATSAGSTFNGSANNSNALVLATVNSNVGSFGNASYVSQPTVNAKGLTTSINNVLIQIPEGQVTGLVSDLAGKPSLNGTGATGTWPVSITGAAGHTNLWDRYTDGDGTSAAQTWLMGYDSTDAKWKPISSGVTKSFLDLGSNAYNSTAFQPLEDQRLSKGNSPQFSTIYLNSSGSGTSAYNIYQLGNNYRFIMGLNGAAETGSNSGTNFDMYRYADNGSYLGQIYGINRSTGIFNFTENTPTISGNQIVSNNGGTWGINISGNAATASELKTVTYNGTNLNTAAVGKHVNYSDSWASHTGGPVGSIYGTAYNLGGDSASSLSLQLLADVNHNSTASTKDLYFRTGNNLGFQNDWKTILHSGNFNSYALPLGGGTLSGALSGTQFNFISSNSNFISSDLSIGYGTTYQGYKFAVNGTGYFNGTITAASSIASPAHVTTGGLATQLVTGTGTLTTGYKVYTALISQSSSSDPTVTVIENTLGGTITWSRTSAGFYTGTLSSAFTANKTICLNNLTSTGSLIFRRNSLNTVIINTFDSTAANQDDRLSGTCIEIRVYN